MRSAFTTRAVVSAVLLLAAAGGCTGDTKPSTVSSKPPPVPSKLADGTTPSPMPDALRRFRGRKVIAAKEFPGQAAELLCPATGAYEGRTNTLAGWISTDGLAVEYAVNGANELHSCDALFVDGRWQRCAETALKLNDVNPEEVSEIERAAQCDGRGFMWVTAGLPGAAWALVDHGSFWVAYFALNKPFLRVSLTNGSEGSSRSTVAFVDERGRTILERNVSDGRVVTG